MTDTADLIARVRACQLCAAHLPLGPRPVLQFAPEARILIAGQAPGVRVHRSGIPFDDPSGVRLREWLGIDSATFYDAQQIALLPMGFCYPGTGASGDLPPRRECAEQWRGELLARFNDLQLTILLGNYAIAYHLGRHSTLTDTVRAWQQHWPQLIALPHPSPRNNRWLARNPWFASEVIPALQHRVAQVLKGNTTGT
ncbi:Uracil-DNA glycosylase [Atopomonas hussainii]|uniref:Uracil-DNA glycosylase n=1 Tax=Atopomonas hussainii TaxID=1429083 RepID=A0A1H7IB85_9GAMM|nr:uracil-DNA glycosylase family protein [Atopomonas hussainii]SEK59604.1 Uracil-DNA glycosylase [Atopomonas hussainii]